METMCHFFFVILLYYNVVYLASEENLCKKRMGGVRCRFSRNLFPYDLVTWMLDLDVFMNVRFVILIFFFLILDFEWKTYHCNTNESTLIWNRKAYKLGNYNHKIYRSEMLDTDLWVAILLEKNFFAGLTSMWISVENEMINNFAKIYYTLSKLRKEKHTQTMSCSDELLNHWNAIILFSVITNGL